MPRMGASLSLANAAVSVIPGSTATLTMSVRNNGTVVDQFDMVLLGETAAWIHAEPASVSLFPGAEGQFKLIFHPPRESSIAAGPATFAVKAASHQDPNGSAVEEGSVIVEPFENRSAELVPRTSRGKRRAVHELAVDNRGNHPITVALFGVDKDRRVNIECNPARLEIPAGQAQFAKVIVKPPKLFWKGTARTFPFTVDVVDVADLADAGAIPPGDQRMAPPGGPPPAPDHRVGPPPPPGAGTTATLNRQVRDPGAAPVTVDGAMVQDALLARWLVRGLLMALAGLLLLTILWFTLVKPQIKTSAKEAVKPIDERLDAAGVPALPPKAGGGGGGGGATTTTSATSTTSGSSSTGQSGPPFITRLQATSSSPTATYAPPAGKPFALTDLVFQNPQGDAGRISLSRGSTVLYEFSLENFRSHDLHLISPVIATDTEPLVVSITCVAPGPGATECADAVSLSGFGG